MSRYIGSYTIIELIKIFSKVSGRDTSYYILHMLPSDIAAYYADPTKANVELGWKAEMTINQACADSWNWQSKNPNGYKNNL